MADCIFCEIAAGRKGELIWQNDVAAAFNDIHPKAPVHILVIPKKHIKNLDSLDEPLLAGNLLMAVREVADQVKLLKPYKVMIYGDQVDHLHIHIMGEITPQ